MSEVMNRTRWFKQFKTKAELIDFMFKNYNPSTQKQLKDRENMEKNATYMFDELQKKPGYLLGLQHDTCMCGKDHDELIMISAEMLEKPEWKDKDRLKVVCYDCLHFLQAAVMLYGKEKSDKIVEVIWGKKEEIPTNVH